MTKPNQLPTDAVSVLIESDHGVTEFFLRLEETEDAIAVKAMGAKVSSGTFSPASVDRLVAAIRLAYWAETHATVFVDGRVVYDNDGQHDEARGQSKSDDDRGAQQ